MVVRCTLEAVIAGEPLLLPLLVEGPEATAALRGHLLARGSGVNSTPAAVITDAVVVVFNHPLVVNVHYSAVVDAVHVAVVVEPVMVPIAAMISVSGVPKSIINATVEAD